MLELYHFHGATCGLKSRLALAEKGVEYVGHAVERDYLRTPEYRKLNPNGVVPTLIHNGDVVLESSCIINYIDDVFDAKRDAVQRTAPHTRCGLAVTRVGVCQRPCAVNRAPGHHGAIDGLDAGEAPFDQGL